MDHSDVKSTIVSTSLGAVFSFLASMEFLTFATELGYAFIFGLVGAAGGFCWQLLIKYLKSKYNGKTNQEREIKGD